MHWISAPRDFAVVSNFSACGRALAFTMFRWVWIPFEIWCAVTPPLFASRAYPFWISTFAHESTCALLCQVGSAKAQRLHTRFGVFEISTSNFHTCKSSGAFIVRLAEWTLAMQRAAVKRPRNWTCLMLRRLSTWTTCANSWLAYRRRLFACVRLLAEQRYVLLQQYKSHSNNSVTLQLYYCYFVPLFSAQAPDINVLWFPRPNHDRVFFEQDHARTHPLRSLLLTKTCFSIMRCQVVLE